MKLKLEITENRIKKTKIYEFYVDDKPLSEIIGEFYSEKESILENWTNVFSDSNNRNWDLIVKKQFLLEQISDSEIQNVFPKTLPKNEIEKGINRIREYLNDGNLIIYGCKECGDFECGGYHAKITKNSENYIWTFENEETHKKIILEFSTKEYVEIFNQI
jgi:hypothetical protein